MFLVVGLKGFYWWFCNLSRSVGLYVSVVVFCGGFMIKFYSGITKVCDGLVVTFHD